ncbi:MAG: hypothetical protein DME06_14640, partial [Candidatus Rokuibacteriota bacterium]
MLETQPVSLKDWAPYRALAGAWTRGDVCLRVSGLWGSARALVVGALLQPDPRPCLVLVSSLAEAQRWAGDLRFFGGRAVEFPPPEPRLWRGRQRETDAARAVVCHRLLADEPLAVVATPAALTQPLPDPAAFRAATIRLSVGDRLDRELLLEALERAGYERAHTVAEVGQWGVRGGIVDVFGPADRRPVRIELLGDEIESIRLFDPTSQRSTDALSEVALLPLGRAEATANLLAYLPPRAPVVLDQPELLDAPPEDAPAAQPLAGLLADRQRLELGLLSAAAPARGRGEAARTDLDFGTLSVARFDGQFRQLAGELTRWIGEGTRVRLAASDTHQADSLRQILREHLLEATPVDALWGPERLAVVVGECSGGFAVPALGIVLLTEEELFGGRRRTLRRPRYERGAALTAFSDLAIGDLVVHEDHGIGRYLG